MSSKTNKKVESKKEEIKEVKNKKTESKEEIEKLENKTKQKPPFANLEKAFCIIIGIIFLTLAILSFSINELIPATLITLSLELFSICYFRYDNNNKKINILFIIGVLILLTAVFYTIYHIT